MLQTMLNNRYQIIQKIGQGGFGTTYLAKDIQASDSLYAIKQLNPDNADIETAKRLFKREADILLRLQEVQQVPKLIDYFEENNNSYIVEEYIKGTSLDNLLGEKWNSQQIVIFIWEILSILQLLHQKNIIHRDIKPSNLIQRERDSKLTIIDFGAVKELKDTKERMKETCIYNHGYAPPEQVMGVPRLNSDIYALGMTAIQLLTKTHPKDIIKDENDNIIWTQNLAAPNFLTELLNKMVKNNFQQRYQSIEEVLKAIKAGGCQEESEIRENPIQSPTTRIPNNNTNNDYSQKDIKKLWYILLLLVPIVIVSSEIIHPWIRPWYYLDRGNSLLDNNEAQASLNKFKHAIDLQRDSASAWKGRGDALFTLRRYSGALEAYEKAIAVEPNNLKAINNKGKILYKQGKFQQAIDAHQQAIAVDPNNADAWSGKGLAYMSWQKYEQALESFDKAQNIEPENPTIWLQKGIVLRALKRPIEANMFYQEALAVYDEVTAKDKNNPLLWTDRGFVLLQLNRPEEAFASYDRALSLNENFYEALLGKANVLNSFQKYEQALEVLNRAKEIRPKDYQVWYNRGNLLLQALNKPEPALTSFEQATQLKADFYPAWLGQGLSLTALKQYSEALEALNTAKDLNPQDPFVWMNQGIVLEELGELEAALEAYRTAAIDFNFAPAREHLEQLQQKLGL